MKNSYNRMFVTCESQTIAAKSEALVKSAPKLLWTLRCTVPLCDLATDDLNCQGQRLEQGNGRPRTQSPFHIGLFAHQCSASLWAVLTCLIIEGALTVDCAIRRVRPAPCINWWAVR